MNAVFIAVPRERGDLSQLRNTLERAGFRVDPAGVEHHPSLFVERDDSHVYVFLEEDAHEVPEAMAKLVSQKASAVIVVEYSSIPPVKSVIELLANDPNCVVDNDHWTSLPGPQFIQRLRAEPLWDWRVEPRPGTE
jgi:hypothetical protein